MLRVGPQSAGAAPGPACYGQGGTEATVTDANLRARPYQPGLLPRRPHDARRRARAQRPSPRVAERARPERRETALAIVRIANNNMVGALRSVLIERGLDPRDFTLCAFGGAGPLHATDLMREMGIPRGDRAQPSRPVLGPGLHPDRRARRPPAHDPAHQQPLRPGPGRARSWRPWSTRPRPSSPQQGYRAGDRGPPRRWRCAISARTTSSSWPSAPTPSTTDADRAAVAVVPRGPQGPLRLLHPGRDHRDRQLHRDRDVAHGARPNCRRWRSGRRRRPSPCGERRVFYVGGAATVPVYRPRRPARRPRGRSAPRWSRSRPRSPWSSPASA